MPNLTTYQSSQRVLAGKIVEVLHHGCYVRDSANTLVFVRYQGLTTAHRAPTPGDYWVVDTRGDARIYAAKIFEEDFSPLRMPTPSAGSSVSGAGSSVSGAGSSRQASALTDEEFARIRYEWQGGELVATQPFFMPTR